MICILASQGIEASFDATSLIPLMEVDTPDTDLLFPIPNGYDPSQNGGGLIDFNDPLNATTTVVYDPNTGTYIFTQTAGDSINMLPPSAMTFQQYMDYQNKKSMQDYWDSKVDEQLEDARGVNSEVPDFQNEELASGPLIDVPGLIKITPQGSAEIKFGFNTSRTDNPVLPERQRRITTFDFDQQIQMNLTGQIGDFMKIGFNYNTQATFDFENELKLGYSGEEDDIIQLLEAGNVSMPLNSSLIQGSQSLFGIKSQLRFGRLTVTTVLSQDRGQKKEIEVAGGAQVQDFELNVDNYEENRHYYINQYFGDTYDATLSTLPIPNSQIQIQRMEVWVTNRTNDFEETRNIIAFTDLGESNGANMENASFALSGINPYPDNANNTLYGQVVSNSGIRSYVNASNQLSTLFNMQQSVDYEKLENARLLSENEYSYNSILGFISLNQSLNNDEVLAVSYQYTIQGETYQVGEFSTDGINGQDALYLKLIKSTVRNPKRKLWDLMMKNVYSLGAYQIDPSNFRLDIWYNNPSTGIDINYIPRDGVDDQLLIQLLKLDQLTQQQAAHPDGVFDFIPIQSTSGRITSVGTINPRNGRLYFSTSEPFGKTLDQSLIDGGVSTAVRNGIVFQQLYDSTKTAAQLMPELNRFKIKGTYQSSVSSEISLNALNIPEGSVQVTAGGRMLTEGQDYTVDYNMGRVKILNDGILSAGTPIKIALESNSLFSIQQKSLIGTHIDYKISNDAQIGATAMRLTERPLTQKVNIGDEPIKNTMLGLDGSFKREFPFITKLVDKIPFIDTKAPSIVNASGEVAAILPGHSKAIGKSGNSFIDDFEGSQSSIDIRSFNTWVMASVPQGQPNLFPEADDYGELSYGMQRSKIAWYVVDPLFHNDNSLTPDHIKGSAMQMDNRMRQVLVKEVFPNKQLPTGALNNIPVFDIAYYPEERGPYNFDTDNLDPTTGNFTNPQDRWAGIMRTLTTNDFEAANIEYIQFWVMDPFSNAIPEGSNEDSPNTTGGELYFNLGNVSEDILRDGRKSFENGMPADGIFDSQDLITTAWGWMPTTQVVVVAFDNDVTNRINQDVGLDGLRNDLEANYFADYLSNLTVSTAVQTAIQADPSNDNYHYFRGDDYDIAAASILERYKNYNNPDGNSSTSEQSALLNADAYSTSATTLPNIEDINSDNNLNETESYFQYKVNLKPQNMAVGTNYIVNKSAGTDARSGKVVDWYQFRIPVSEFTGRINGIQDFRAIRFIRMFMKGWSQEAVLRFARLELVRGEWRSYKENLRSDGEYLQGEESSTTFNVTAVNLEDNGKRVPINYVLPDGVNRETNYQTANLAQQNEQSLVMDVCGLQDGDARAAIRNVSFDVRNYNKIEMYVHAEDNVDGLSLSDNELTVFVRLGTDFDANYYEYEMPVKVSLWGDHTDLSVWPIENNVVIDLNVLKAFKRHRNDANASIFERWTRSDSTASDRNITIKGNPNLAALKTIMVGVRNPKKDDPNNQWLPDDGEEKCAEIWINELRLTDFNESAGWATIGRISANLADFADVSVAGNYSSPGWGSIEKSVSERSQEHIYGFDASTTVQMGNFLGDRIGLRMPVYLGYSRNVIRPLYDPLNPDLILTRQSSDTDDEEWNDYVGNSIDLTERRSINFTNVSLNPKKKDGATPKPHFYSISNFSGNFSYNELNKKDINTKYNDTKNYLAGFNYSYSKAPKPIEPFKKIAFIRKSKWLKSIRDFNFYLAPKQVGFNSNVSRTYNAYATRYNFPGGENLEFPQYNKTFNWDRKYTLKYDLTKALQFDFSAMNRALIDEPFGEVNTGAYGYEEDSLQRQVNRSLASFGKTSNYGHSYNVNYKWPLNKIPAINWISLNTKLTASYDWTQAPLAFEEGSAAYHGIGNTIQNSRQLSWNTKLTMKTLYGKVPYLKKINDKYNSRGRGRSTSRTQKSPVTDGKDDPKDKDKKKDKDPDSGFKPVEQFFRILMMVDNVTGTYTTTDGILMPGYDRRTDLLGLDGGWENMNDSPWEFVAGGAQERDIFGRVTGYEFGRNAYGSNWMVDSVQNIPSQYMVNHSQKMNIRATLKPITGLKIDLTGDFNLSENKNSTLGFDENDDFDLLNTQYTGMYSRSIIAWRTAFVRDIGDDENSLENQTFNDMLAARAEVSQFLAANTELDTLNPNSLSNELAPGFGKTHQDVLIGAFMTAYMGTDVSEKNTNPFRKLPLPNWKINYDGLSKVEFIKKYVKRISFSHAYRANMNIAGFTTNLNYKDGAASVDLNGNVIQQRQILQVSMMEQFSPLLGVDLTLKNDIKAKFEFKKDRTISLGLANNQITEIKGTEITFGTGYTWKDLNLGLKFQGKPIEANDLVIRFDMSIRDNKTIIRKIVEEQNQATAGQKIISIKFSASYELSDKLSARLYFDRVVNNPFISTSYPTANTAGGIALRFQL
ncbi:MAG: cell surface protein SprA [Flavobacteriales bacterium]